MEQKWSITRIILTAFSSIGVLFILTLALNMLFKWDFNLTFVSVVLIVIGLYNIIESNIKSFRTQFGSGFKRNFHASMNMLMFAVGLLLIYVGVTVLPHFGVLSIPLVAKFNGWILLSGAVLSIGNIFRWI